MPLAHPAIVSTSSLETCFSSPGTNLNYTTHAHATCSFSNLIHLHTCNHIESFYVDDYPPPTITTTSARYPYRISSTPFQSPLVWTSTPYPPPNTNHITSRHLELAYKFVLSSRHSPGINLSRCSFNFPSSPSIIPYSCLEHFYETFTWLLFSRVFT